MAFSIGGGELCVRGMLAGDAAVVQRCRNLSEVARYQSWRPETVEEVVALSHEQVGRAPGMQKEPFQLVIEVRDEQGNLRVAGDMGSGAFDPGRQMEIGIVLDPAWQGRGLATRACRLLFDHLFAAGLHRITARVDPRNDASTRLFERLQFVREGLERQCWWDDAYSEWTDEICFAMLAKEWSAASRD
ncbi:MAG: RimJ/RimL family protein N-acetyltransferase [Hyphomicrobiaceae bacterium]|jgi:RimJ/RimL family protein N-acetyltransferase